MIVLKQSTVLVFSCNFSKIISQLKSTKTVVIGNFGCVLKYLALKTEYFSSPTLVTKALFSLFTNICLQNDTLLLLSLKSFSRIRKTTDGLILV
jgi:hypothetical protein